MSLNHLYRKAGKIVDGLPPEGRKRTQAVCREIRKAQADLLRSGEDLMARCIHRCQGLCCRNIQEDSLITLWDFVYILVAADALRTKIPIHLKNEDPLFPSDCIFLENGEGPCIFPSDVRPERCLTAFCFDATPIRKEIAGVKWAFHKLAWTVQTARLKALLRAAAALVNRRIQKSRSGV